MRELRRLSKEDHYQVTSSEAPIYAGMSHLMLRRSARSTPVFIRNEGAMKAAGRWHIGL